MEYRARNAPPIHFREISLAWGGDALFQRFSLDIEAGKCTCILGPSGCGKSTLLRLVSGSQSLAHEGKVHIQSRSPAESSVAWMSQDDLLLPWFSLMDNALLGAKLRGTLSAETRKRAQELIVAAGLAGYEQALPSTLSGGMRQRTALLRTLMEDRPILLMDEPFSALDALTRMRLQNLSSTLTRGATVMLVTHDPMEALRMGHRIVLLSGKPTQVKRIIHLVGEPYREADDPQVQEHFSAILHELMDEEQ